MCNHRLWPDVEEVVCHRADPHEAGTGCLYVADTPSGRVADLVNGSRQTADWPVAG
jgi:hypothetical protein